MNLYNKFNNNLNIFLIIVIGFILRFQSVFTRNFWFDEAITWHFSRLPITELIPAVASDNNPPLYYLLIHFLLKISSNEIFLRLFSIIINLVCIPVLYLLGKKIFNKTVGLFAAVLFSVSALNIYIGSEARLHVLGMLFILFNIYVFYICLNKPAFLNIICLIISLVLAVYTQYYAWLLLPAFIYIVKTSDNQLKIKRLLISFSLVIIISLLWIIPAIYSNHNQCACPNSLLAIPSIMVSPLLNGVGEVTLRSFSLLSLPVLFLFIISSLTVIFLLIKGLTNNPIQPIFIIPVVIVGIAGIFYPVFSPKAFSVFSPIYFLIIAYGISKFKYANIVFWVVCILFLTVSLLEITNPFFFGSDFKTVITTIKQKEVIPIYHTSITTYYPFVYYSTNKNVNNLLTTNPLAANTVKYIGGQQNNPGNQTDYIWLVINNKYSQELETVNKLEMIKKTYIFEKNYYFNNLTLIFLKHK